MSKFSFVIEIKGGKPVGTAFSKDDAQQAKELFNRLRDEGKEAYYFQHPNHDKRCKSAEQTAASKGTEGTSVAEVNQVAPAVKAEPKAVDIDEDIVVLKKPAKNSIGGV